MLQKVSKVAQAVLSRLRGDSRPSERVNKMVDVSVKVLLTIAFVGSLFAYTTNGLVGAGFVKQAVFVIATNLALLLWLAVQVYARRISAVWSSVYAVAFSMLVVVGVATGWSQYVWGSLVGTTVTTINAISIWSLVAFSFLLTQRSRDELVYWVRLIVGSAFGLLLLSFLQFFGVYILPGAGTDTGAFTPFGTIRNLGVYLVLILPLILAYSENFGRWRSIPVVLGVVLLVIFFQPTLFASGWWLVVGAIVAWYLSRYFAKSETGAVRWIGGALLLFAVLMAVWPVRNVVGVPLPANVRMTHTLGYTIATDTVMGGVKQFLVGTGPSTFAQVYMAKRPLQLNAAALVRGDENVPLWSVRFVQPSSVVALLLVTLGVLGTVAFLALVMWSIWIGWRVLRVGEDPLVGGIVASVVIMTVAMFVQSFSLPIFVTLFALLGLVAARRSIEVEKDIDFARPVVAVGLLAIMFLVMVVGAASVGVQSQRAIASYYASTSVASREAGEYERAVNEAGQAVRIAPREDAFVRLLVESWLNYAISLSSANPIDEAKLQNAIVATIQASARAEQLDPTNGRNVAQLAFVFRQVAPFFNNAANMSAETYARAEELEPTNPALPTERARSLLVAAQYPARNMENGDKATEAERSAFSATKVQEAETALAESVNLKSDYAPARFLLANLAVQQNRVTAAIAELTDLQRSAPQDAGLHYQRGLLLYSQQAYTESRDALQQSVALQPRFANAKYFLGLTLAQLGDINGAIAQFEEVKNIDEASSASVDPILANLRAGRPPLANVNTTPDSTLEEPVEEVAE